ncbi:MAG: squalene/phytoene synthase family protein [Nitratireductor sp.]
MTTLAFDHCRNLLREADYDRHASLAFLAEKPGNAAAALYAFDAEIARIPLLVSEPAPGEIRMQWWREVATGERESGGNPVGECLRWAIEANQWPAAAFERYFDARIGDLYNDPMPDRVSFEGYAGDTVSSLLRLVAIAAGAGPGTALDNACGHAGIGLAVARCLQAVATDRKRQRVMIPADILAATGLDARTFLAETPDQRHFAAVEAFSAYGTDHFSSARASASDIDPAGRLALLSAAPSVRLLAIAMKSPATVFAGNLQQSPLSSLWRIWRCHRAGRAL